jgi:hypothetical protein
MPWWRNVLPFLFARHRENLRVSSTLTVRKLAPGMIVFLAAFPKSANRTVIDCSIFACKSPNVADLEALKSRTSSEVDRMIAKVEGGRYQASSSAITASFPPLSHVNEVLEAHLDAERTAGAEIHPAARSQNFSMEGKADDDCKKVSSRHADAFLTRPCSLQGAGCGWRIAV